ncbi:hypothetical protein LLH03_20870 [bacterium]|nr:hypothetical protein [bacterium]
MNTVLITVDPGVGGGIACRDLDGVVCAWPMPDGMTAICDKIRSIAASFAGKRVEVIVERVGGYMPGNSGPAACTFARHCGNLDAAFFMAGLAATAVAPQVWMKAMGALPKEKPERKRKIKEIVARRFPHLDVTLKTADALGMMIYAMQRGANGDSHV